MLLLFIFLVFFFIDGDRMLFCNRFNSFVVQCNFQEKSRDALSGHFDGSNQGCCWRTGRGKNYHTDYLRFNFGEKFFVSACLLHHAALFARQIYSRFSWRIISKPKLMRRFGPEFWALKLHQNAIPIPCRPSTGCVLCFQSFVRSLKCWIEISGKRRCYTECGDLA